MRQGCALDFRMNLILIASFLALAISCSAPLEPAAYKTIVLKNFYKVASGNVPAARKKTPRRPLASCRLPAHAGSSAFKPVVPKRDKAQMESVPNDAPRTCPPWGCDVRCCQRNVKRACPPYLYPNVHEAVVKQTAEELWAQQAEYDRQQPKEGDVLPSFNQRFESKEPK